MFRVISENSGFFHREYDIDFSKKVMTSPCRAQPTQNFIEIPSLLLSNCEDRQTTNPKTQPSLAHIAEIFSLAIQGDKHISGFTHVTGLHPF